MFAPQRLPSDSIQRLSNATNNEFVRLSQFLAGAQDGVSVRVLYAPPSKYSEGTIVYADGTSWNPGSGRGFYYRAASTWEPLAGTGAVAPGSVTTASLAANLALVEVVTALPSAGNFNGRTVYLTTDGQLYRYYSSAWTAAVPAVNVTGQLTNSQIADLSAAKLTGQITETQITDSAISTAKLAAGSVSTDRLAATAVTADKIASNAVTAVKISAGAVEADKIATNAVTAAKIAANAVTAGKIDAGAVTADKISVTSLGAITTTTGTLIVDSSGHIRGGQTAYNTGTGFFLGYSGSAYKFSIGSSSKALLWDGSNLTVSGAKFVTGSGGTPSGGAFEVTNTGVTWVSSLYSLTNLNAASGGDAYSAILVSQAYNKEGLASYVASGQSGLSAHAIRGQNIYWGTSGLVGGATSYDFYADGTASNYGPFTGAHDVLLNIGQVIAPGDIVVDVQCVQKSGLSNTLFLVEPSSQPNQRRAIGVFVAGKGLLANNYPPPAFGRVLHVDEGGNETTVPGPDFAVMGPLYDLGLANAVGEGQINVCGEGGDIQPGDLIVTSSMAGKGMKQADDVVRGYTVAKAREAAVFSSPSEVKQIACIYVCG